MEKMKSVCVCVWGAETGSGEYPFIGAPDACSINTIDIYGIAAVVIGECRQLIC